MFRLYPCKRLPVVLMFPFHTTLKNSGLRHDINCESQSVVMYFLKCQSYKKVQQIIKPLTTAGPPQHRALLKGTALMLSSENNTMRGV